MRSEFALALLLAVSVQYFLTAIAASVRTTIGLISGGTESKTARRVVFVPELLLSSPIVGITEASMFVRKH